jgi:hypothetical protein
MIPRPTENYENGGRSTRYEMAETAFKDFEHRNRKLFCIMFAHNLLQHFNDLAEGDADGSSENTSRAQILQDVLAR